MSYDRYLALRAAYDRFRYESYEISEAAGDVICRFRYSLEGAACRHDFVHVVRFAGMAGEAGLAGTPDAEGTAAGEGAEGTYGVHSADPLFVHAVFLLGLAEAVSYWKTACPPQFEVVAGALSAEEASFWNKLFTRGLGEFWWLNGIYGQVREDDFIRIASVPGAPAHRTGCCETSGCLVPVGGGKDSVVTLELLKAGGFTDAIDCFLLSARVSSYETAALAGFDGTRQAEAFRVFDPQLFALNREGYLNGHVPYSAILGFTAVAAALLRGRRYIVLSNEGSANEPTVPGTWVNHQYSKSLEFEADFTAYVRRFLTPSVTYFSLLRPWSEARIAEAFARHPIYHPAFRSCNRGSKENRWCCACPKCLFVFLLVAAHAGVPATAAMFGENLLVKPELAPILDELAGFVPVKPFECVGTVAETRWSLDRILADSRLPQDGREWALTARYLSMRGDGPAPAFRLVEPELAGLVPPIFRPLVLAGAASAADRIRARLVGLRIGILGFGMEGKSTLAFLQTLFPQTRFRVADRDGAKLAEAAVCADVFSGGDYAAALADCDLVFKAPGIPWKSIEHLFRPEQVTSQTDLFLSVLGERTIGITGTKGKSTTTALVAAALRSLGHDAVMVGNIGLPALDAVSDDAPGRIYVLELSSHMLETVRHAPRGAIYLNLYEEHLDHYRSFAHYAAAKDNLLRLQGADGFAIAAGNVWDRTTGLGAAPRFRPECGEDGALRLPVGPVCSGQDESVPEPRFSSRLLRGTHNLRNLQTALLAVHLAEAADLAGWRAPHADGSPALPAGPTGTGLAGAPALLDAAIAALNGFPGLPHRLHRVGSVAGITFWNDSISTIPQACIQAVQAVGDVDALIFGGLDRGIDYGELERYLAGAPVPHLIALPDTGHHVLDRMAAAGTLPETVAAHRACDMAEAVAIAFRVVRQGRSCLLSPAAASYGWYRNFEERGMHFETLVRAGRA